MMKRWALILGVLCIAGRAAGSGVQPLDLKDAIQQSSQEIGETFSSLGKKPIIAVSVNSHSKKLSRHVQEHLNTHLVPMRHLTVVDRENHKVSLDEIIFQARGDVDDDTLRSLGKKLGASSIVYATFEDMGDYYEFILKTINVETAVIEVSKIYPVSKKEVESFLPDPPEESIPPAPVVIVKLPLTNSAAVGSLSVSSEIAGMLLLDGAETGTRIKVQGTVVFGNVSTGYTEVAVKEENGRVTKAPKVLVKEGQTVRAAIEHPEPPAPRNVRAGTPGTDRVTLTWDSAGSGIRYKVYYGGVNDPARAGSLSNLTDGMSVTISGLSSGTDYYFWVSSVQNGKESPKSSVVLVKTAAAPTKKDDVPVPDMVRIQGGTFMMGSPASEAGRDSDETQHQVRVSSFWMGKYEVTVGEFRRFVNAAGYKTEAERNGGGRVWTGSKWEQKADANWRNPSISQGDNHPVVQVSWNDAVRYCNWLSEQEGLTPAYTVNGTGVTWNRNANGYRLPTEAEWEYACRAGTTTPFSTGNNITTDQANYDGNYPYNNNPKGTYRSKTTPVGSFPANPWGLYDMHGNVWEWCWDWYGDYASGSQTDPAGASSGSLRVFRGGSWGNGGQYLRSAKRLLHGPSGRFDDGSGPSIRGRDVGFRVLRP